MQPPSSCVSRTYSRRSASASSTRERPRIRQGQGHRAARLDVRRARRRHSGGDRTRAARARGAPVDGHRRGGRHPARSASAARQEQVAALLIVPDGVEFEAIDDAKVIDPVRRDRTEARDGRAPQDARPRLAPAPEQGVPRDASSARLPRRASSSSSAARRRRRRGGREARARSDAHVSAGHSTPPPMVEVTVGRARWPTRGSRRSSRGSPARRVSVAPIRHPRVQKSGLALAGHYYGVVPTRVQVLGETELSYLDTLDARGTRRRGARLLLARALVRRGDAPRRAAARRSSRPRRRRARRSS